MGLSLLPPSLYLTRICYPKHNQIIHGNVVNMSQLTKPFILPFMLSESAPFLPIPLTLLRGKSHMIRHARLPRLCFLPRLRRRPPE